MTRMLLLLACALSSATRAEFPLEAERAMVGVPGRFEASAWIQRDRARPKRSSHSQIEVTVPGKIEIEFSLARLAALSDESGAARPESGRELEVKWVPFARSRGWSWGVYAGRSSDGSERGSEIILLGTFQAPDGQLPRALHVNLGRVRESDEGVTRRNRVITFAYEHGAGGGATLLAEIQAIQGVQPLRHVGVRYRLAENAHLGIMVGENRHGRTARIGMALDFD